jgi:hypothetical protein
MISRSESQIRCHPEDGEPPSEGPYGTLQQRCSRKTIHAAYAIDLKLSSSNFRQAFASSEGTEKYRQEFKSGADERT